MTLYRLEGVQRLHGVRTVLDIGHLEIERNRIYSLTGPNGAGKTTLLRLLAFLDEPDRGRIQFDGAAVKYQGNSLIPLRRQVVLLDQQPVMFSGTVRANVEFGLRIRKVPPQVRKRRAMEMLELVNMQEFADRDATLLSGGETKRVALARVLAVDPMVLLCDEPTANVDQENQEIIVNAIRQLNQLRSTSIIFATHYHSQAHRLADRTLYLQHGHVATAPHDNGFPYTVVSADEKRVVAAIGEGVFLRFSRSLLNGPEGRIYIDPEQIVFADRPGSPNAFTGSVEEITRMGDKVRLVLEGKLRLVMILGLEEYRDRGVRVGERVDVVVPDAALRCAA